MTRPLFRLIAALLLAAPAATLADLHQGDDVRDFIEQMSSRHGFDKDRLAGVLGEARIQQSILEAISRPAEAMPWHRYRTIFIREDRIRLGSEFLREHRQILERAEQAYGVPAEIISAILGVETRYGSNTGAYRVIDSLVTLGFRYPKRSEFFKKELEQFLLLAREQRLDPLAVKGSYAGAMGIPQFISSSFRHYAVDFDGDGSIDIWDNVEDAIGSVANYFSVHGWKPGRDIAFRASASGDRYRELLGTKLEPDMTLAELDGYGVKPDAGGRPDLKARLLSFELEDGEELWLGLDNFYVITRYNHSALYAMAVYQLAREIARSAGTGAVSLK
jgi:membrane-bound lytic murein transglycosylase B